MSKEYLGDGVYVTIWHEGCDYPSAVLTTEDGYRITNTIFLEPEVLANFLNWIEGRKISRGNQIQEKPTEEA